MRKSLFWLGWFILIAAPIIYAVEIYIAQDLPPVKLWQWPVLVGGVALTYFSRNRDDVLKHHVV